MGHSHLPTKYFHAIFVPRACSHSVKKGSEISKCKIKTPQYWLALCAFWLERDSYCTFPAKVLYLKFRACCNCNCNCWGCTPFSRRKKTPVTSGAYSWLSVSSSSPRRGISPSSSNAGTGLWGESGSEAEKRVKKTKLWGEMGGKTLLV